jgi:hypothetical protein
MLTSSQLLKEGQNESVNHRHTAGVAAAAVAAAVSAKKETDRESKVQMLRNDTNMTLTTLTSQN